MDWKWSYAIEILPQLGRGLLTTLWITIVSSVFGLIGGLLLGILLTTRVRVLSRLAALYVIVFRNSPLLVQLYLIFFALPEVGIVLSPKVSAILALGLFISAYMADVYRGGINDVPAGQWEACTALNLSRRDIWLRIVLPQAIPPIIPMLGNYTNLAFKLSAYAAVIGTIELLGTAMRAGQRSYRYIEPFTMMGLIYLVVSALATLLISLAEKRLRRSRPSAQGAHA